VDEEKRMQVTTTQLRGMKRRGQKIAMLTAYDYPTARLLDTAGVHVLLVGDSLGMVMLGYASTVLVTMDDMVHHCRAVTRGASRALIVADLPFMSTRTDMADAMRNAARLMQVGGAQAVKLEGAGWQIDVTARLVQSGIPVMGHLGLTPQSVHQLGGFRLQARSAAGAERLRNDALALQEAGAFAVVLETVPAEVAAQVTATLDIPTIGIGAGPHCDGQVQVLHDIIGMSVDHVPGHARQYINVADTLSTIAARYVRDVTEGTLFAVDGSIAQEGWAHDVVPAD